MICKYCGKPMSGQICTSCGRRQELAKKSDNLNRWMSSSEAGAGETTGETTSSRIATDAAHRDGYQQGLQAGFKNGEEEAGKAAAENLKKRTMILACAALLAVLVFSIVFNRIGYNCGFPRGEMKGSEEGYVRGSNEGYRDGEAKGKAAGNNEGKAAGLEEGKKIGIEEGKELGRTEGIKEGKELGKADGIEEGKGLGRTEGIEEGKKLGIAAAAEMPSTRSLMEFAAGANSQVKPIEKKAENIPDIEDTVEAETLESCKESPEPDEENPSVETPEETVVADGEQPTQESAEDTVEADGEQPTQESAGKTDESATEELPEKTDGKTDESTEKPEEPSVLFRIKTDDSAEPIDLKENEENKVSLLFAKEYTLTLVCPDPYNVTSVKYMDAEGQEFEADPADDGLTFSIILKNPQDGQTYTLHIEYKTTDAEEPITVERQFTVQIED